MENKKRERRKPAPLPQGSESSKHQNVPDEFCEVLMDISAKKSEKRYLCSKKNNFPKLKTLMKEKFLSETSSGPIFLLHNSLMFAPKNLENFSARNINFSLI